VVAWRAQWLSTWIQPVRNDGKAVSREPASGAKFGSTLDISGGRFEIASKESTL
jgi:hypothetical protein